MGPAFGRLAESFRDTARKESRNQEYLAHRTGVPRLGTDLPTRPGVPPAAAGPG